MACLPVFIYLLLITFCDCEGQLTQAKRLISPGDVIVSKGGVFALGFFSLGTSNHSLFLGIWYHDIPERTYVWVANRNNPIIVPSSAMLSINNNSNLVLSDSKGHTLWATNNSVTKGDEAYVVLLDSGNLVLRLSDETTIWQSFDHPTDTILLNMKFLVSYKANVAMQLVAWKGPNDPSTGDFSMSANPSSDLQFFLWNRTRPYCRFIGPSNMWASVLPYGNSFIYETSVSTEDELYFMYTTSNGSLYMRLTLDYMGTLKFMGWNDSSSSWAVVFQRPARTVDCDPYDSCGPFGYCDAMSAIPRCQCLDGFEPGGSNSSRGCRRKQQLRCGDGYHFVTMPGTKVPDKFLHVQNRSFEECAAECSYNCSCTAYAYANFTGADKARCLLWTGELVDTGRGNIGDNLYLRLADSIGHTSEASKKKRYLVKIAIPIITCLLILTCIYLVRKGQSKGKWINNENQNRAMLGNLRTSHELFEKNLEFSHINFEDVTSATNNFSEANMLGKGGFRKVYKGKLEGGKEVAVKRLSTCST